MQFLHNWVKGTLLSILTCLPSSIYGMGYIDFGFGITTQSSESEEGQTLSSSDAFSPDLDFTVGYSFYGLFIGGKIFSNTISSVNTEKATSQEIPTLSLTTKTEYIGNTSGYGFTFGYAKLGLLLTYTSYLNIEQDLEITQTKYLAGVPNQDSQTSSGKGKYSMDDGKGYQIDFFYGMQFGSNVFFGPKISYLSFKHDSRYINNELQSQFKGRTQSKITPKIGVISIF